ncbi:MAG: hypothetical protein FWH06_05600 [Oscillospiraceae bacterium]|nr:hypothetical protein [Oscillospiraceae bacterium]
MGSPAYPSKRQTELLKECARPRITTKRFDVRDGDAEFEVLLTANAVCYFELQAITPETDRGFTQERIQGV